jgi:hypothetical protein
LLILGTAKARSMGVATRNVTHLRGLGVPIYDPFDDVYILQWMGRATRAPSPQKLRSPEPSPRAGGGRPYRR